MKYVMKLTVTIETLAKKNSFRDSQITQITNGITAGTIESYSMDIIGMVDPVVDIETYKSP